MTRPEDQPAAAPTVSTGPAHSRWRWSAIPSHLGRARTSTVVLVALFLAIGALYLEVRPAPTVSATTGQTGIHRPASPAPDTVPETTTPAPETTTEEVPTTTDEPTTSEPTTGEPTGTTGPDEGTTDTDTDAPTAPSTMEPTRPTTTTPPTG